MHELASGSSFGPYTIEGLVAGGGMGSVYAARHQVYGSPVALKILHADLHADSEWRRRFNREGLVGVQLKHPHILSARELVMEDDGRVALVLDLVNEGQTLQRLMSRDFRSGLPLVQALQVLLGLIQAMEYAHDKDVVHGDIKPENVLIEGEFRDPRSWMPKITDFGTVGILAHPVLIDGQPAVVVSPRYASPEHMLGMEHLSSASDIYCIGLLLHYLLTGQHASVAQTVEEAADTVARPPPLTTIIDQPDSIIRIFQRATSLEPRDRFASCREFAVAIRAALDVLGAELNLDDLTADLATEIIEERRDAKRKLWADKMAADSEAEVPQESDSGTLGEALEPVDEGSTGKTMVPSDEHEETGGTDPVEQDTAAADEEDTADDVLPFAAVTQAMGAGEDAQNIATEVPQERAEGPVLLPQPSTPEQAKEAKQVSVALYIAVAVLALIVGAIVVMNPGTGAPDVSGPTMSEAP